MIRPLDLQTLYMNLDKVGKEQAQSKEAQAQAQAFQVQKLAKEHDQGAHSVKKTNAAAGAEGDTSVKVDAEGRNPDQPRHRGGRPPVPAEEPEPEKKENAFQDPELGKHVDLSG